MSMRLNFILGFVVLFSLSLLAQQAEAQRFGFRNNFRNSYRSCPQPVRYVPANCPTSQFFVPGQGNLVARPAVQPGTMNNGNAAASQLVAPAPSNPAPVSAATAVTTIPVANVAPSPMKVEPVVTPPATQTVNPVNPSASSENTPILNSPATLEPVPAGDTQIVPVTPVPVPTTDAPKSDVPPAAMPPKAQPTPAGAKSILESSK